MPSAGPSSGAARPPGCGSTAPPPGGRSSTSPLEEAPRLLPAPVERYDLPIYAAAKVHRDHHIEAAKALYSIPGGLIGQRVDVRADRQLVKVFHRGVLVKTHPRQPPGHRSTDPDDLPAEKTVYAMRDLDRLLAMAAAHGPAIGAFAVVLLDSPLPWTKMRQVYALLGLVKKWGAERVDAACARAADLEAFNVALIGRMLARGSEIAPQETFRQQSLLPGRFARPRTAGIPYSLATIAAWDHPAQPAELVRRTTPERPSSPVRGIPMDGPSRVVRIAAHAHVFGRPWGRHAYLEAIRYAKRMPGVWFATRGQLAQTVHDQYNGVLGTNGSLGNYSGLSRRGGRAGEAEA